MCDNYMCGVPQAIKLAHAQSCFVQSVNRLYYTGNILAYVYHEVSSAHVVLCTREQVGTLLVL